MQPLTTAVDPDRFGGKAVQLGAALAAGLPVPGGFALSWTQVEMLARDASALADYSGKLRAALSGPLAVRSSAVGEDSAGASFAGQHCTRLGVHTADDLSQAILAVHASAFAPAALAYRARIGVEGPPRIGVVVQELVDAECAGVLFTRNPLDGSDERVIEAAWGLGEAVVGGLVTPDRFRVARNGRVLEQAAGEKDLALRVVPGGVREQEVDAEMASRLCLDPGRLERLNRLAMQCEEVFGSDLDLEWAFREQRVYLLQQRPITRTSGA